VTRPPWEVADVIRIAGSRFRERYGASLTWPQVKGVVFSTLGYRIESPNPQASQAQA
jgi:hypothetical protein